MPLPPAPIIGSKKPLVLLVFGTGLTFRGRLLAQQRIPAMYANRVIVASGGLMSYDADALHMYRRAASYVGRILGGEKPADLPFQEPTKFQLTINLKAAKLIGLDMPQNLIAIADEVIE
jgi:putative ABC transport system substrate-binding protein